VFVATPHTAVTYCVVTETGFEHWTHVPGDPSILYDPEPEDAICK
jgi:hypothetical protein